MARRRYNHSTILSFLDYLNELYNRAVINGIPNYRYTHYNLYYDYETGNLGHDDTNQTAYTIRPSGESNNQ